MQYVNVYTSLVASNAKRQATKFVATVVASGIIVIALCAAFVALVCLEKLSPWVGWIVNSALTAAYLCYLALRLEHKTQHTAKHNFIKRLEDAHKTKHCDTFCCQEEQKSVEQGFAVSVLHFSNQTFLLDETVPCPFLQGKTYDLLAVGKVIVAYKERENE